MNNKITQENIDKINRALGFARRISAKEVVEYQKQKEKQKRRNRILRKA